VFFTENRDKLLNLMNDNSVIVIQSNSNKQRSNDTDFPYRQDSNFYYLTGFKEDSSAIVLSKKEGKTQSYIFVHPKDPLKEMWAGKRMGVEKAADYFNVDFAYSISDLNMQLEEIFKNSEYLYLSNSDQSSRTILENKRASKEGHLYADTISDADSLVLKLRRKKQPYEIEMIKEALKLTSKAHHAAMAMAAPSKKEYEVMALVEYLFKSGGASWDAYTTIVAGGNNANVLHYIENSKRLVDGDLILMDAGAEFNLYASDVTRTFPVNGKFSTAQKELYSIVLETQKKVITEIAPGVLRSSIGDQAIKLLSQGLKDIGVLKEGMDEIIENELYKPYYPHGIGHWMGLDVHDPVAYKDSDNSEYAFEAGDILTIEPGLYLDASDERIPKAFRGIGIRIEDDILLTESGHENLSEAIAKEIDDVELMCQKSLYDYI
jgi:Xaa-Pro aminopeptidase